MSEGEQRASGDRPGDDRRIGAALPYVPGVLVHSLARWGSSPFPWSDEIDGTLVMADISGFTTMSEQLAKCGREGAEQLTDIITSFFTSMLDKARVFGGDTITYGGDAMLLLFSGKDHERRAVAASLDMLDAMRAMPPFRVGRGRIRLGMSMGAHSGRFPIFGAGTSRRAQFFILGPATVRTAECEALANSGELVVSAETEARCRGLSTAEVGEGLFRVDALETRPAQPSASKSGEVLCAPEELLPHLPPFVADAIARGEEPPALDSDHRKASIVFVNVLGVDELLSEGPDVLAMQLQTYVAALLSVLERHGGYLVSNDIYTNGFKLIIAFGAPIALEGDAERAVRFSIELRDEIDAAGLRLRQRIGVNRGDVFAGDVGPEYRRQYTVMGDAVNLSARLMSAAEAGAAMTTCEVARTAGDAFSNTLLAPIRVKGKSQPIDVCLLETETTGGHEAVDEFGQELFVGRDAEMAFIAEAVGQARAGEPRLVSVFGDPGIGKSRLVAEEVLRLTALGWHIIYGMSYQHTSAMPFTPWVEVLTHLMRLQECGSPQSAAERVHHLVKKYAPREAELACLVGQLLDLPIPETDRSRSLDAASRREALFDLVVGILGGVASERAVCLVLEDLHWADSSTVKLLAHVASSQCPGELLLLATCRPETGTFDRLREISTDLVDLTELDNEAALALVSSSLGVEIPAEFATLLLRKSKGNPLFLQEVARSIVHTGALARIRAAASTVAVEELLADIDIPDRVQGLLMSRVDHLDPGPRELLRTASVIGATFTMDDAISITDARFTIEDETALRVWFDDLVRMEFLEPVNDAMSQAGELRFTQPLLQEVTYNSVRFARRRALHRTYAEHLEQLPDQDTRLGALVHHYSRCGEWQKTSLYGVKAADRAAKLFAHREAVDYSRVALSAIKGSTPVATWERSCVVERIGDEHESWGHHRDGIRSYKDALNRWGKIEDDPTWAPPDSELAALIGETPRDLRQAVLCRKIGTALEHDGRRYDLADEWLDRALVALPPVCTAERARILVAKGLVTFRQGHYEDTVRLARQALTDASACGDPALRAMALNVLWAGYDEMGELEKAIEYQLESVSIFEELHDLPRLAIGHGNLASCYLALGRLEAARRENEASIELNDRLGSVSNAVIMRVNLAEILIKQGRFDDARDCLSKAFEGCDEIGAVGLTGYASLMSARLHAGEGALEAARADLLRAIELLKRVNARGPLLEAYIEGANLALQSGNLRGAARAIERAEQEEKSAGNKLLRVRLDRVRGLLARRQRRFSEAHASLRHSIELAREIGAQYELALSILAMGDVAELAPDKWPESKSPQDFVAEAIPLFRRCGAEADLSRAFELLDRLRMAARGESALARAIAQSGAPERHIDAGTLIFAEGESGNEMFLIRSGVVRAFRGSGAEEFTLGLLGPGDFFGEMSIIGQTARSASTRAVTNVAVVVVDKKTFDEVVSDPVAREIIGRMSDRMRELGERAEELSKLERPIEELLTDRETAPAPED